jgi:K+-sensing histidine kinase KdpD
MPRPLQWGWVFMAAPLRFDSSIARAQDLGEPRRPSPSREHRPRLTPDRVLVCMAPDRPESAVLIAGAALAEQIATTWFAVYVVPPARRWRRFVANPQIEALDRNIKLAETLGATVVKITATDVAEGLTAFASREGVTHVIVGRGARSRSIVGDGSTIGAFVNRIRGVELQIIGTHDPAKQPDPILLVAGLPRGVSILIWSGLVVGIIALMAMAPWPVMFLMVIAVAAGWSWWLERRRR